MMGKNKEAEADDIPDQICLAYGHAVFCGTHLLLGYGRKEVGPGSSLNHDVEAQAIRELLEKEINLNLSWFSCPHEMFNLQMAW